ncbi:hypothetical protein [Rossellomorea vietnamensis]|nr:hypothetical protein [Rossellomorea vietnamensis]
MSLVKIVLFENKTYINHKSNTGLSDNSGTFCVQKINSLYGS